MSEPHAALEQLVRDEGRRVLATLVRTVGDLGLAEDAVQDATIEALVRWPRDGVPDNPRAWLTRTARHRAIDRLRRESSRLEREVASMQVLEASTPDPPPDSVVTDDQLRLIFTCCHPALALDARVALTLRVVAGLTTAEVARALLVAEPTMAKRLTRAKDKIARAHVPYRVPADHELPGRLAAVLGVVYLVFTEGHRPTGNDAVVRADLCDEAVRLGRLLVELMPDEDETLGLLALLLLSDARRAARVGAAGHLVVLADQDRSRWDRTQIDEGLALVERAVRRTGGVAGPYTLQAAIAGCHASARTWSDTDWAEVVRLYDLLLAVQPGPVVALNRAVAVLERDGPAAGLAALDTVADEARGGAWHVARAEALLRLGEPAAAVAAYDAALDAGLAPAERRHVIGRKAIAAGAT